MGPLRGVRIIEMEGLGPTPFCGMLLADLGADVIRVDRPSNAARMDPTLDLFGRGKRSIVLDIKQAADAATLWRLIDRADALCEGLRPGVMERNGFGPDACFVRRPSLVYGRMTGFGQDGPLAPRAGHDINYLSLSGALGAIGPAEKPVIPLNLVADFGGGALYLALGMLSALLHVRAGGSGQVVDAAMVDGAASLTTFFYSMRAMGQWQDERESNLLDGGADFYNVYETKDGQWISVGAIEPQFYAQLMQGLELEPHSDYLDRAQWAARRLIVAQRFKEKTRAQWNAIFAGTDACYTPVLTMTDAALHPHNAARHTFVQAFGYTQPNVAPRLSVTPGALARPPPAAGADTAEILAELDAQASNV